MSTFINILVLLLIALKPKVTNGIPVSFIDLILLLNAFFHINDRITNMSVGFEDCVKMQQMVLNMNISDAINSCKMASKSSILVPIIFYITTCIIWIHNTGNHLFTFHILTYIMLVLMELYIYRTFVKIHFS